MTAGKDTPPYSSKLELLGEEPPKVGVLFELSFELGSPFLLSILDLFPMNTFYPSEGKICIEANLFKLSSFEKSAA